MSGLSYYKTISELNNELNTFYKYLKRNPDKYTDNEIRAIFRPLLTTTTTYTAAIINNNNNCRGIPPSRRSSLITNIHSAIIVILLTFITLLLIYYCVLPSTMTSYLENTTISWHITAIVRILMIKTLPYYDWTELTRRTCLLDKSTTLDDRSEAITTINCELCETITSIPVESAHLIDGDRLQEVYLDMHRPVILIDNHKESIWPLMDHQPDNNNNIHKFIRQLLNDPILYRSQPCRCVTNLFSRCSSEIGARAPSLGDLLEKSIATTINDHREQSPFMLHFQNCDFRAVKQFRQFVRRPPFLPADLAPIRYSWLIYNGHYNISHVKRIDLIEAISVVGQIAGRTHFRLTARYGCDTVCPIVSGTLHRGEFLIVTNLWDLEYQPYADGDQNIAVVLETH